MTIDDPTWQAVLARDARADGRFVYAVASTGIYCRPSCPSRRPKRQNTSAYSLPEVARAAGYRPCRRCKPDGAAPPDPATAKVRAALRAIEAAEDGVPDLASLGRAAGTSPHHLQRLFTKIVGVSPRDYADARRLKRLKSLLRSGNDVAGALYEAGYGSASRVYEKSDATLGMTPATYRKGGAGADIAYALAPCPLGRILVAATARGVAALYLGDDDGALIADLRQEFPAANLRRDDAGLGAHVAEAVAYLDGRSPSIALALDVRATAFQRQVWRALRAIPAGETRSYREIAVAVGKPKAARAVGRACATNAVSLVIPCHRAVREDGGLGGYRWGLGRKEKILATEAALRRRAR